MWCCLQKSEGLLIELSLIYFCYFQRDAVENAPGLVTKGSFLAETLAVKARRYFLNIPS